MACGRTMAHVNKVVGRIMPRYRKKRTLDAFRIPPVCAKLVPLLGLLLNSHPIFSVRLEVTLGTTRVQNSNGLKIACSRLAASTVALATHFGWDDSPKTRLELRTCAETITLSHVYEQPDPSDEPAHPWQHAFGDVCKT